ncbi:MAG TPA: SRPBCC family protein [Solirubrobacteraceae bacterium]|nr:SRPBCC family protein [Solirubrobacteraceae bacterium]
MSLVNAAIQIDAPIERVWEIVMDPDRLGEWVTIHRALGDVSGKPLGKGATMEQSMHIRGVTFKVSWTLTDVSAPNRAQWEGHGPAHSRALTRYELSGDNNGATRFDYTNEFTTPGGRLGAMAGRVFVGGLSEREAHKSLERLKALAERS